MTTAGLLPLTTVVTVISRDNMPPLKPSKSDVATLTEAMDKLTTAVAALTRRMNDLHDDRLSRRENYRDGGAWETEGGMGGPKGW